MPSFRQPSDPDAPSFLRGAPVTARQVLAVAAGGVVGGGLRAGIDALWPSGDGFPVAILLINLVGAFALGLLLESLTLRGDDSGLRRWLRLAVGTGLIGGFTTYSTFAVGTVTLLRDDRLGAAAAYAGTTVIVGTAAALLGVAVARRIGRRR